MKICPRCQKTYTDDNLNFCLEDGSVLSQSGGTAAPPSVPNVTGGTAATSPQPQWNTGGQPQYPAQPAKKSKAWVWVLLILAAVVLLCGGGIVGLIIYAGNQANQLANTMANIANTAAANSNRTRTSANSTSTSNSNSARTDVDDIDLEPWVKPFSVYGTTEFKDGELLMSSKQKGYYYVLAGLDEDEYRTASADTSVSVRNIDDAATSMGYGLVFHSDPQPLQKDYAFLIDSKRKRFRVVHHVPGDEKSDVSWTVSQAIKAGNEANILEVRDQPDRVDLYINGQLVKTIKNTDGAENGVVGLYAGDGVKVAFKDLQVRR